MIIDNTEFGKEVALIKRLSPLYSIRRKEDKNLSTASDSLKIQESVSGDTESTKVKLYQNKQEYTHFRKVHLYGLSPYLPDAPFLTADELFKQVGGNTGNLVFAHAVSRMLKVEPQSIAWGANLSHLSVDHDQLVIPLANQLGPHTDLSELAEVFRTIHLPMVGIGLGAQGPIAGIPVDSIPNGSWEWLKVIMSKSATDRPNISLRGQATYDVIAAKGLADRCVITGCPSNFINPSARLGQDIARRRLQSSLRVVVAAGCPHDPQFRGLEQSLVSLLECSQGLYVCQHPIDMLRLYKQEYSNISQQDFLRYKDYIHPDLDNEGLLQWFRRWSHAFTSVSEWLALMNSFDVVVGTRIHGVMVGIQAGLPSLCLCIDSRTLELCQTMMIPYVNAYDYKDGINLDQINSILDQWDWQAYDENRHVLAKRFIHFFEDNRLDINSAPSQILKQLAC